jgi:hypothetical protein
MREKFVWQWATLSNGWKAIVAYVGDNTVKAFCLAEWLPVESRPDTGHFVIAHGNPELVSTWGKFADFSYEAHTQPIYDEPILRNIIGYMYYQTAKIDGQIYQDEKFSPLEKPMPSAF